MDRKLNIAFWVIVGLLILPMVQQFTGIVHERKLRGAVAKADYPEFELSNWFNGSFQQQFESALNDRIGFRPFFIRVNNQVAFSLYRKALASGVIIGKKNYMYEKNYILAVQGEDFLGDTVIETRSRRLKEIQDYFGQKGKHLMVTFAAGKGSFYPEFIPEQYKKEPGRTNLEAYREHFDSMGVNYIDFNKWFLAMKDTSRYCLYPKTGIHWSYYGMVLVIDSLRNYLQKERGVTMPEFEWDGIELTSKYRSSDDDIEKGMNILFRVNYEKLAYPRVAFYDEGIKKLHGVVISDSFYWGLHNIGFSNRILKEGEFWYYFNRIYGNHLDEVIQIDEIDALERIEKNDIIILMATEATLPDFPFGFTDRIYPEIKVTE